ncbi:MAG: AEC family transporter [Candidatus Kariarchaeaceae archaeon]|jgi:predicted permease
MFEIFQETLIIYFGIFLGFIFIKSPLSKHRDKFVNFTINVFTPILIFSSIVNVELDGFNWLFPVIASLLVTGIGIATPKIIAKYANQERPSPAELCNSSFSNALNFPFPIIFAFSPNALGFASIFLATSIVMRNSVGLIISGVGLSRENLKEILTFPPIIAIIFAVILNPFIDLGDTSSGTIYYVFQIGITATLMTVGFGLKKPDFTYKIPMFRVAVARYIVSAIVALSIIYGFSLSSDLSLAIFVQMIAPPAVFNGLYAERFGLDTNLTTQIIVTLTMIALIFLPLELFIVQSLFV